MKIEETRSLDDLALTTALETLAATEREATVALIVHHTRVDAALLDALPTLRLILTTDPHGSGIDVAEAERRGLWVCLPPRRESAAQAAARVLSMALAQLRRIAAERLTCFRPAPRACDLTLGLIGMESAATEFANLALPLFRRVVGTGAQWCRWPLPRSAPFRNTRPIPVRNARRIRHSRICQTD